MKKLVITLAAALIPVAMFSQAQINTKKVQIEDFTEKVTKVVYTGNVFFDTELENAVKDCWKISPYEFCTMDDFKALKGESDYYFLLPVSAQFRKEVEPGLMMLSLLKGGKGSDKSLDKMLEIVSVPVCSAEDPSGREGTFLPALVDIIQTHAAASMEKDVTAYGGLKANARLSDAPEAKIYFAESDIAFDPDDALIEASARKICVVPDDDADALMDEMLGKTIVSYSVCPTDANPNSYCYNMLIGAKSHKLYYYRRYKITKNSGAGFLREDLLRIAK